MANALPEVQRKVRSDISRVSGVPVASLDDEHTLVGDLEIPHTGFVTLAGSLDTFVKSKNPGGSVQVADVENNDATVGSTTELVQKEISPR